MSILKQIVTAIREGDVSGIDPRESISQAIETTRAHLNTAKHDLTEVMAKEMQVGRKIDSLSLQIVENEKLIANALSQEAENEALSYAGKVAELEKTRQELSQLKSAYANEVSELKRAVEATEKQLAEYERKISMVTTSENINKAMTTITNGYSNTALLSAKNSLALIRQKQVELEVKQHSKDESIDAETEAVLARIKAQAPKK